jgi:hypothetical protein
VCQKEGEILFHAPLSVIGSKLHQRLEEQANGLPLREKDGRKCLLRLDDLCHPSLIAVQKHPDRQSKMGDMTLKAALEAQLLPRKGHCCIRDLGGEDW